MENLERKEILLPDIIYLAREYEDESLNYTDTQNMGDVLLVGSPTQNLSSRYWGLKDYTIEQLKTMLATTNQFGKNNLLTIRNIGIKSIPAILNAIELYSSQVERQAQLTEERNINLLELDKERKLEIAEDLYSEIILYLIYNANGKLFWGELSDDQKKLFISSTINNKKLDKVIRNRMINAVANYTTLPEMEKMAEGKMKVLNRFL